MKVKTFWLTKKLYSSTIHCVLDMYIIMFGLSYSKMDKLSTSGLKRVKCHIQIGYFLGKDKVWNPYLIGNNYIFT